MRGSEWHRARMTAREFSSASADAGVRRRRPKISRISASSLFFTRACSQSTKTSTLTTGVVVSESPQAITTQVRIRNSQTNKQSREWVHRLPEEIEAPSASSKTPACKTCFVLVACIVASVKAPAVSDVAASANIHTAPLRRNANNADTNSRLRRFVAIF